MLTGVGASASVWDLSHLMQRVGELYQPDHRGRVRLAQWQTLMEEHASVDVGQQLDAVNRFFNDRLRFEQDSTIWDQTDYWASPVQSLIAGAADCEDFTIAKYFTLRQLGIDEAQLRLTYVKATERNQAHMVLAYYATPTSAPLILDNLIDPILTASQRDDLVPVYSFNASGLWLGSARFDSRAATTTPLPRWQELTRKMSDEGFFGPLSP
ncbi:transglutaminase-like cysteine proteinase BTLCP [Halopseudomonas xinjiangensis]|uniref:Transglutaminase-like cysteine proteinase BTLCP n=1 Tax=Halopseudomonas xinjiangensis TaxID=487184 RepID=A0A1H1TS08_9GAMM|nr:transglutaminase-like cysteine peptidase [Halopseudomonas xinjiangensis]SDS62998.1 transglutaminase-like cysteine proteinase BTLCP [Halopseudomonas xinjiangensis]